MASHSHSGGPTAFWENRPTTMTLSRPLRLTPHWAKSWVAPCLPKAPTATVVAKRSQTGTRINNNNNGHTRLMSAYLIRVARAHNLPSLEAPERGTTIHRIRAVPYRQMWLHWKKSSIWRHYDLIPSALWLDPIDDGGVLLLSHIIIFSIINHHTSILTWMQQWAYIIQML